MIEINDQSQSVFLQFKINSFFILYFHFIFSFPIFISSKRDLNFAISTMVESFIQSQKFAVATQLGRRFGRYRALAASPEEFIENVLMDQMR